MRRPAGARGEPRTPDGAGRAELRAGVRRPRGMRVGHGIDLIQASAGTGKTTTLGVLASAYRDAGYQVLGATPTARAARELEAVGVRSQTIAALALRLARDEPLAPDGRLVIVADENAMAGTT